MSNATAIELIETALSILVGGITLFITVARPLMAYTKKSAEVSESIKHTTQALTETNDSMKQFIEENKREHEMFRNTLTDHEKRIFKMEG